MLHGSNCQKHSGILCCSTDPTNALAHVNCKSGGGRSAANVSCDDAHTCAEHAPVVHSDIDVSCCHCQLVNMCLNRHTSYVSPAATSVAAVLRQRHTYAELLNSQVRVRMQAAKARRFSTAESEWGMKDPTKCLAGAQSGALLSEEQVWI